MKGEDLEVLLAEDAAQSFIELAKQLVINHKTVLRRLHVLGKIQEKGKFSI